MYFFKKKGHIYLDMQGDLILSHNKDVVLYKVKSAIPHAIYNAKYLLKIHRYSIIDKIKVSLIALRFIWLENNEKNI